MKLSFIDSVKPIHFQCRSGLISQNSGNFGSPEFFQQYLEEFQSQSGNFTTVIFDRAKIYCTQTNRYPQTTFYMALESCAGDVLSLGLFHNQRKPKLAV